MLDIVGLQSSLLLVIFLVLLAVKSFALIDCIGRPADQFSFTSQLDKKTWLIILSLALIAHMLFRNPLNLLSIVGTLAALVYLAQLRGSN